MPVTSRDYETFVNYSPLMELVERDDNLLDQLGLFEKDYHQGTRIEMERITDKTDKMYAVSRDADRQIAGKEEAQLESFKIPFFTLDHVIRPKDLQDLREYGTAAAPADVQKRVERLIKRIQRGHADLHRRAMFNVLTAGTAYAKKEDGTDSALAVDFATVWGVDPAPAADIDFTNQALDPSIVVETKVRKHINDNIGDNSASTSVIGIVGSGWFNAFTKHALIREAYLNRDKDAEVLTDRFGGNAVRRVWTHDGVTYIEETDVTLVARDKAYFIPLGVDNMFKLDYAPANTIEDANEIAEEAYLWVEEGRRKIKVESETSVLASCTRPEIIVRSTGTIPAGM
jgi:hypothetical protein